MLSLYPSWALRLRMLTKLTRLSCPMTSTSRRSAGSAASRSIPSEWNQAYAACVGGVENARLVPKAAVPAVCSCFINELRQTPEADRDKAWRQIASRCVRSATIGGGAYAPVAVERITADCLRRTDIARSNISAWCTCWAASVQNSAPWNDYLLLEDAWAIKGVKNLDEREKAILGELLRADHYCTLKLQ